jgi:hypothetical protein
MYYAKEFNKWDAEVKERRRFPENSYPSSVAIVTFHSPLGIQNI